MRRDVNDLPNPFADGHQDSSSRRLRFVTSVKLLVGITVLFSAVLISGNTLRKLQIRSLTSNFDNLSAVEKQSRLQRLASYHQDGIPAITQALVDADESVALTAYQLLGELQQEWIVLPKTESIANHRMLVESLRDLQGSIAPDRAEQIQGLLQQAVQASVDQTDELEKGLYSVASEAIQSLDAQATKIQTQDVTPVSAQFTTAREPLPVEHLADGASWTDWPPRDTNVAFAGTATAESPALVAAPAVYQSAVSPLRAVPENEIVVLRDIAEDRTHAVTQSTTHETAYHQPSAIQTVAHIIEAPLQDADVTTVIGFLDSDQAGTRDQATSELTRRGFDDEQIAVASQIAGGDLRAKIELVRTISKSDAVDPRPWLLMLMNDQHREVRLRAISALGELKDPWVQQQLRLRMVDEKDRTVAFRIRRVLNLR